ncbi:hypothetical protein BD626DRAFT_488617 [Schizophyllum amplum]|uniref:Transcription factor hoxa13 n=1 Tax=Schizophyllum amplum TaxID=97359 RepID=A0A550CKT8_9AGAR|nr:hypothetical protein BD626DRAFT_488617 [Auriculariopsis ampla]
MVVTRKAPVAPAPAQSRAPSTQNIRAKSKTRSHVLSSQPLARELSTALSQPSKVGNRKVKKHASFLNRFILFALACLCIYSIATCSSQDALQHPLCRSLSTYRTYVVEPYIIPPLKAAVNHPSVYPYVQKVQQAEQRVEPYFRRGYQVAEPVVRKGVTIARPYAKHAKHLAWDRTIVPQFYRHAIPRYNVYVRPHIDKYIVPAQQRISHYAALVEQYMDKPSPYVMKAADLGKKAYDIAKPRVLQAYSMPDVMRFSHLYWERLTMAFVDPHVLRIWDKVVELSGGDSKEPTTRNATEPATEATTIAATPEMSAESMVVPEVEPTATFSSSKVVVESSSSTVLETASSKVVSHVASATAAVKSSASSVVSAASDTFSEAAAAHVAEATPSQPAGTAEEKIVDEEDVDSFLQDLLGADHASDAPSAGAADPATDEPSTEELEERKRIKATRIAEKRQDITARHAHWDRDLQHLIATSVDELRLVLSAIRQAAARELRKGSGSPDGPKEAVDGAQTEGERLLRGLDSFLKKAAKAPENPDTNKERWSHVLDMVEVKFSEAMGKVQVVVSTWYDQVRQREAQEVKALAERAQADIGIDYAWLDDVTYSDWQRYHDLMRSYEKYDSDARTIANGTHPLSPEDPLISAMSDTQHDAMIIIEGFQVRVRDLKLIAHDIYSEVDRKAAAAAKDVNAPDVSALPVGEPSQIADQLPPAPQVSILPIDPNPQEPSVESVGDIFVGRGAEEVKEAVARAESFGASVLDKGTSAVAEAMPTATPSHEEL